MALSATSSTNRAVVVIAGPTASGKSALALALAARFNGVIINADSQQRYRDFPILTAQPSGAERARILHRLFGDLDTTALSTAAEWAALAAREIETAWRAGRLPFIVGGTGLYLRVLMEGVSAVPPIPDDVRAAARGLIAQIGNPAFHARLALRDPISAAKIPVGNTQRLARAWEVVEATGTALSVWQGAPAQPFLAADYLKVLLMPAREALIASCDARFQAMLAAGAREEVAAALARGVDRGAPAMHALGAVPLADHLAGSLSLAQAVAAAQIATRQYAKRQVTWFRNQFDAHVMLNQAYRHGLEDMVVPRIEALEKGGP